MPDGENWLDASANIWRKLKTMYIDTKYGYPLKEKIDHTKNIEGAAPTWASGDYDQLRILETMTSPHDVMVDVGCGQGRVINYWLEKGFNNRIVGIESDESIANATRERLKKYKNVEIICGDATKCTPLDATFIYLFNPFDFDVHKKFADYIWDNRDQYGRNGLQILLYNCEHAVAFDEARFIRRRILPHDRIPYPRAVIWLRDRLELGWTELPISATHFLEGVGARVDDKIVATGEEGCLAYGPYIPLAAGRYSVRFAIETNAPTEFKIDVIADRANRVLALKDFNPTIPVTVVEAEIETITDYYDVEFRVFVPPGSTIQFSGVEVKRLARQSIFSEAL